MIFRFPIIIAIVLVLFVVVKAVAVAAVIITIVAILKGVLFSSLGFIQDLFHIRVH